jgi:general stress protein YciG
MSDNPNPGNFANRPHEEVENIARKGGQSSHQSGFASMDPNKQVRRSTYCMYDTRLTLIQHDIASKGGQASGGSFEPGDPRAREAGRKGGQSSGQPDE